MANVTLVLDEDTLRKARIYALEHDSSLNALVREYLETLVGEDRSIDAGRRLVALAKRTRASSGPDGRTWSRDDLHEDR